MSCSPPSFIYALSRRFWMLMSCNIAYSFMSRINPTPAAAAIIQFC